LHDAKIARIDRGIDEILRRYRRSSQPPEHCQLPGMSHRISQRTLEESFFSGATQFRSGLKVSG
jgi:hypothetical protein